ncbi:uncharacterized protein LOC114522365 [Dendronephthya gigantea]|uniref:uncharacterized protein LOC114522365 n=1 Tax=Dendronephthya gigantea TaxID=151771 RepID=UPI00106D86F8|nr:uncharacterized protein LOC114522365 [Dendronephthya gigantea]
MEDEVQWTKNLRGIPAFTHALLLEHLITDDSSKLGKPPNAHKHKKYGYQLFKDKMVTQVKVKPNVLKGQEKFFLFKCVVHASMKKAHYAVYVHLRQDTGKISHASCTCTAGKGGCCKHVAALLFQILDYIQLELPEVPDDLTCTQLLQQWHVPNTSEKLESAVLFDQVKISKATSKTEKHYVSEYNNPAPVFAKCVNVEDLKKLEDGLKTVGTCDYLQGLLASNNCEPFHYQEFVKELPSKKAFNDADLFANQMYNVEIRKSILEQITVPDFTEVCKYLPSQEYMPYTKSTLYTTKEKWLILNAIQEVNPNVNYAPEACQWGNSNEQMAIQKYLEQKNFEDLMMSACVQCGLFVNIEAPWLGASPDCLLHDHVEPSFGIGEVKCPFSKKEMTIIEACKVDPSFYLHVLNGKPQLKRNHHHFYQIQGVMSACKVNWGDFIVYTNKEVFSERIYFDHELWYKTMLPKLTSFYFTYIYPKLAT